MNRGFKFYFKEGLKALKGFLTKKTNILSYYLCYYVVTLTKMLPFLAPLGELANVRMVRMIRDEHKISITNAYVGSSKPKNYWTLVVSDILKVLIILIYCCLLYQFIFLYLFHTANIQNFSSKIKFFKPKLPVTYFLPTEAVNFS